MKGEEMTKELSCVLCDPQNQTPFARWNIPEKSPPTTTTTPQCSVQKEECHLVSCSPSSVEGAVMRTWYPFVV